MNTALWLVRREFWENRAIWMIPAVIGALLVLASLFGKVNMNLPGPLPVHAFGQLFMVAVAGTFFVVMSIYATWYLLDCLYADRRDRSVLFWKSLPISDTTTVLSKLGTALVIIPLVYFAAADATTLIMAFIVSVRAGSTIGAGVWHLDLWVQLQVLWIYLIVTTAIWYLPIAGYLMVVSAWAKRAVMLWSILPPIALLIAERWFVGTHVTARLLWERMVGWVPLAFHVNPGDGAWVTSVVDNDTIRTPQSLWSFLNAADFFSSPETWLGAAAGAVLIIGAIQLRMRRTEI
jgi:ABC-2 type transport system permease protein